MNTVKIQNAILSGDYSFAEIAEMFNMTVSEVNDIYEYMVEDMNDFDDSMDGDFDSAMASAGFGTDEDYGYYGEEY
jgi:hypothetical protein